jgi:hypothetical protein
MSIGIILAIAGIFVVVAVIYAMVSDDRSPKQSSEIQK